MRSINTGTIQFVDGIIKKHGNDASNLLPILLETQSASDQNYISQDAADHIAARLNIPLSRVASVIAFFSALSTVPRGRHVIKLCRSTACLVNGYQSVREILENALSIRMGETTADGLFSLEYTECIGACDISPALRINQQVYGNLDAQGIHALLQHYREVSNG